MSITWKKRHTDPTGREVWENDGETHVGLVMSENFIHEERVMSDIYAPVSYCLVWNPQTRQSERLCLGHHFELCNRFGHAAVDIDPQILEDWEKFRSEAGERALEAERLFHEQEAEKEAERELKRVKKGSRAVVVKGRKVPRGTVGTVIWTGDSKYGPRIGLQDDTGKVYWTAESNVEGHLGTKHGKVPRGGWRSLKARIDAAQRDWAESFPQKGDSVLLLASGIRARVFWTKGERLGVRREGVPESEEPTWVNAWEVAVLDAQGNLLSQTPCGPAAVPFHDPTVSLEAIEPVEDPQPAASNPSQKSPLAHLPFPLCEIARVEKNGDSWKAYTVEGEFVMKLAEQGAYDIMALLEGAS